MASRVLAACDAVAALLAAGLQPSEPDRVRRAYVPVLDRSDFAGWRVWVYPAGYRDRDRLTRGTVRKEVRVAVEVEVKYDLPGSDDEAGRVPPEWVDGQVAWVEADVYGLLNETGVRASDLVGGRFRAEACEVTGVLDPGRLHGDKVFASLIEVTYSEIAAG
jgi:hypothetical protein